MSDPYIDLQIGDRLRIVECIGQGGIGAVYKAEQAGMDRFVAVKILQAQHLERTDLMSRFRREARSMSHLSHPATARVFFFGQLPDGALYLVMEYLEGRTLVQTLRAEGPFRWPRLVNILIPICGALEEAHRCGIIHRDLKPENIMLTEQGGLKDFAKLLDFGLARVSPREIDANSVYLTHRGAVFGTPEFMSPEQALGDPLDRRSDIYSLGIVIYEALTGKLPFDVDATRDPLLMHVRGSPTPLNQRVPGLAFDPAIEALLDRALQREPDKRFATAAEFAEAIAQTAPSVGDGLLQAWLARPQRAARSNTPPPHSLPKTSLGRSLSRAGQRLPPVWLQWTVLGVGLALAVLGSVALAVAWSSS